MDALEKSNTKLTEEVSSFSRKTTFCSHSTCAPQENCFLHKALCTAVLIPRVCCVSLQLAVANNRIITLQEDVERVKEESSYQLESRKVKQSLCFFLSLFICLFFKISLKTLSKKNDLQHSRDTYWAIWGSHKCRCTCTLLHFAFCYNVQCSNCFYENMEGYFSGFFKDLSFLF